MLPGRNLSTHLTQSLAPRSLCPRTPLNPPSPLLQDLLTKLRERGMGQPQKMSLEAGPYMFHYAIVSGVCYLCLTDKG